MNRDMIVVRLEYGAGYSKVGGDPFTLNRVEVCCNMILQYSRIPFEISDKKYN